MLLSAATAPPHQTSSARLVCEHSQRNEGLFLDTLGQCCQKSPMIVSNFTWWVVLSRFFDQRILESLISWRGDKLMFTMSLLPDRFIPFLSKSSKNKSWNPAHTHYICDYVFLSTTPTSAMCTHNSVSGRGFPSSFDQSPVNRCGFILFPLLVVWKTAAPAAYTYHFFFHFVVKTKRKLYFFEGELDVDRGRFGVAAAILIISHQESQE